MDVAMLQYPPGDPRMIDTIVHQLKSQGIFDQFRKECIADVDTKPAYQNLHQRVEGTVSGFLAHQVWRPDLNKNQVRESLRKHILESGYLDLGVERIVDQVVNPKIMTVLVPQVEDVVYKFIGIEKPKKAPVNHMSIAPKDLLPKDLDPVSPESDVGKKSPSNSVEEGEFDEKDGGTPPPFNMLETSNDNSMGSHLSGISGLTSPDDHLSNISYIGGKTPLRKSLEGDSNLSKVSLESMRSLSAMEIEHSEAYNQMELDAPTTYERMALEKTSHRFEKAETDTPKNSQRAEADRPSLAEQAKADKPAIVERAVTEKPKGYERTEIERRRSYEELEAERRRSYDEMESARRGSCSESETEYETSSDEESSPEHEPLDGSMSPINALHIDLDRVDVTKTTINIEEFLPKAVVAGDAKVVAKDSSASKEKPDPVGKEHILKEEPKVKSKEVEEKHADKPTKKLEKDDSKPLKKESEKADKDIKKLPVKDGSTKKEEKKRESDNHARKSEKDKDAKRHDKPKKDEKQAKDDTKKDDKLAKKSEKVEKDVKKEEKPIKKDDKSKKDEKSGRKEERRSSHSSHRSSSHHSKPRKPEEEAKKKTEDGKKKEDAKNKTDEVKKKPEDVKKKEDDVKKKSEEIKKKEEYSKKKIEDLKKKEDDAKKKGDDAKRKEDDAKKKKDAHKTKNGKSEKPASGKDKEGKDSSGHRRERDSSRSESGSGKERKEHAKDKDPLPKDKELSQKEKERREKERKSRDPTKRKKAVDDHHGHRERRSEDRRSADGDSNGAAREPPRSTSASAQPRRKEGQASDQGGQSGGSGGNSEQGETNRKAGKGSEQDKHKAVRRSSCHGSAKRSPDGKIKATSIHTAPVEDPPSPEFLYFSDVDDSDLRGFTAFLDRLEAAHLSHSVPAPRRKAPLAKPGPKRLPGGAKTKTNPSMGLKKTPVVKVQQLSGVGQVSMEDKTGKGTMEQDTLYEGKRTTSEVPDDSANDRVEVNAESIGGPAVVQCESSEERDADKKLEISQRDDAGEHNTFKDKPIVDEPVEPISEIYDSGIVGKGTRKPSRKMSEEYNTLYGDHSEDPVDELEAEELVVPTEVVEVPVVTKRPRLSEETEKVLEGKQYESRDFTVESDAAKTADDNSPVTAKEKVYEARDLTTSSGSEGSKSRPHSSAEGRSPDEGPRSRPASRAESRSLDEGPRSRPTSRAESRLADETPKSRPPSVLDVPSSIEPRPPSETSEISKGPEGTEMRPPTTSTSPAGAGRRSRQPSTRYSASDYSLAEAEAEGEEPVRPKVGGRKRSWPRVSEADNNNEKIGAGVRDKGAETPTGGQDEETEAKKPKVGRPRGRPPGIKKAKETVTETKLAMTDGRGKGRVATPTFVMPLSPESDVSASSAELANRKAPSVSPTPAPAPTPTSTKRATPAASSRAQRYSSDDLYKPRPLFSRGRRARGPQNDDGHQT